MRGERTESEWSQAISRYEGLIRKTAARYVNFVEEDFDDLCSIFRAKAWRALLSYDPERATQPEHRYVFSCIKNQGKDLIKRAKRNWLYIEDLGREDESANGRTDIEAAYLSIEADQVFARIDEGVLLIPSTLTETERQVLALLYLDYSQKEALLMLGLTKRETEKAVRAIREKMEDWRPSEPDQADVIALDSVRGEQPHDERHAQAA